MTDSEPDPQQPLDPQRGPLPEYPEGPERIQPMANPRPIRASRVWAGIGLAFLGHVLALCASFGINAATNGGAFGIVLPVVELLVFLACIVGGIIQLVRGDRGLGVGLLVGWAVSAFIFAGACVVLILLVANALG